jgi:hypothetical protein
MMGGRRVAKGLLQSSTCTPCRLTTGEESEDDNNMSTDQAAGGGDRPPPLSASTPTRTEKQPFRIVDIESNSIFKNPGDVNSAEGSGDGNSAYTSDANSVMQTRFTPAIVMPVPHNCPPKEAKLIPDPRIRSWAHPRKFRQWSNRPRRDYRQRSPQKRMLPPALPMTP